jgi:transposase
MRPLHVPPFTPTPSELLDHLYCTTTDPRRRTRSQVVWLSAAQKPTVATIAATVREREATVLRWLTRYLAEGLDGLHDAPRPGRPADATEPYRAELVATVRRRPRSLGLPCSLWTLQRRVDDLAERTGIRVSDGTVQRGLKPAGIVLSRPQHPISSPDPRRSRQKKTIEDTRDQLQAGEVLTTPTHSTSAGCPPCAPWEARGASTS